MVDATYQARQDPDPFPETLIEVDGSEGTLRLRQGYALTVTGREGTERRDVAPALLPWASRPWHGVQESVLATQRHWLDCLRSGAEPATSGADNLKTFALCEAAYASAARGDTVTPGAASDRGANRSISGRRGMPASERPPIDQSLGGEECPPHR